MKKNSRFLKTAVAAGLALCSGAAVLGVTSFVSAEIQDPQNPAVVAEQSATAASTVAPIDEVPAPSSATPATDSGNVGSGNVGSSDAPSAATAEPARRNSPIAVAATALGMTEADLVTELQAGKSISDVATARGVALSTVTDALYADLKAHIDAHVAAGDITQAQADVRLAAAKAGIAEMVTKPGLPMPGKGGRDGDRGGDHGPRGERGAPRFATEGLAKVLGLSLEDLNTQIKAGKTLAQIAEAQKVEIQMVKNQLLFDYTAKEQAEVAEGKHTQAEVDAKIAEFTTRLDDIVNGVRPPMGPGGKGDHGPMGGQRPMGGRGHRGGHGPMGGAPGTGSDTQGAGFSA